MKKTLFIALIATLLCSCGGKKFIVQGQIEGLEGTVYMFQGDSLIDSAAVVNGAFELKGKADATVFRTLLDSREGNPQNLAVRFIPEEGTIIVTADAEHPIRKIATGTPTNDASAAYNKAAQALMTEYRNPETTDERREAIETEYDQLTADAVDANLNNLFGVMMLQSSVYDLSGQEILDKIAAFTPEMQASEMMTKIKEMAEAKKNTEVGQPYIEIEQPNADGQIVTLTSVVRHPATKYVLVDFWASWCSPCMGEVPVMLKTYKEFHDKGFEIYGVSFDNNREKWLGAIEANGMNWIHVSELKSFDNQAARDYAIQGIPSNFLISADGDIVATNLRGEALYEKVAELLK